MTIPTGERHNPETRCRRALAAGAEAERLGRFAEAEEQYREALEEAERLGPDDPRLADSLAALGILYAHHGRLFREGATAAPLLERALAIRERALSPKRPEVAQLLIHLASIRAQPGQGSPVDAPQAVPLMHRALTILAEAPAVDPDLLALASNAVVNVARARPPRGVDAPGGIAGALSRHCSPAEAEALYLQLIALWERRQGPEGGASMARSNLACFYEGQGRLEEAEQQIRRVMQIEAKKERAGKEENFAFQQQNLARLVQRQGRWPEAAALLREALAAREAALGPLAPGLVPTLTALAELCLGVGEYEEAERLLDRARNLAAASPLSPPHFAWPLDRLQSDLLKATGRYIEAWIIDERTRHGRPVPPPAAALRERVTTPRPDPDAEPEFTWISFLIVGYVTERSVALRCRTTREVVASVHQSQRLRGGGGRTGSAHTGAGRPSCEHARPIEYHDGSDPVEVEVFADSPIGVDRIATTVVPARVPDPAGAPRLAIESMVRELRGSDLVEAELRLVNQGDGEAHKVQIEGLQPAEGWQLLAQDLGEPPLPLPLPLGRIAPGGAGIFITRLRRISGPTPPGLALHGGYSDASGKLFPLV